VEADLEKMLDKLFISARWQHTNAYTDNDSTVASHYYFDNSWDLAYINKPKLMIVSMIMKIIKKWIFSQMHSQLVDTLASNAILRGSNLSSKSCTSACNR
jgi:hypothetical protein